MNLHQNGNQTALHCPTLTHSPPKRGMKSKERANCGFSCKSVSVQQATLKPAVHFLQRPYVLPCFYAHSSFVWVVNSLIVSEVTVRAGSTGVRCLHVRRESNYCPDFMTGFLLYGSRWRSSLICPKRGWGGDGGCRGSRHPRMSVRKWEMSQTGGDASARVPWVHANKWGGFDPIWKQ